MHAYAHAHNGNKCIIRKFEKSIFTYRSRNILISELASSGGMPDQEWARLSLRKSGSDPRPPHVAANSPIWVDVFPIPTSNTIVSHDFPGSSLSDRDRLFKSLRVRFLNNLLLSSQSFMSITFHRLPLFNRIECRSVNNVSRYRVSTVRPPDRMYKIYTVYQ